ncbi:MAG TPA: hypothetical protein VH308_07000 [Terracidiphilus sp.]|nr:hypothetical protein [Terracidiphilus sp.]
MTIQRTEIRDQGSENNSPWRRFIGPSVILLAAAVAVAPQMIRGNSCGHDFDFHLVSWFDALNAWRHGLAYPHWTPSANYGAGEPRFVFYSPLSWMLGAALAAMMPWAAVPVAMTFLLLAGTGLATRALACEMLEDSTATLAGCIALFSGYALFTAYERSAFAELAGGLWIPLVLLYCLRDRNASDKSAPVPDFADSRWTRAFDGSTVPLAVAIAASWLSNPTVGVMACYTLAAIAIILTWLTRSWWPLLRSATGAALGMGLSAIYLLPAAWEQRWVDIHEVTEDPGQTLENNWLFATHADPSLAVHDQVLRTASTIAVIMIALTFTGLFVSRLRGRMPKQRSWWIPLAFIPCVILLLQFPFSRPLWNLLPDLRFLQFPWRWLLVLEAPMAVFVAAAVWPRDCAKRSRRPIIATLCAAIFLALTFYAGKDLYQVCDDEDAVPAMLTVYRSGHGFIGTFEYEPVGADNSLLAAGLPPACLVSDPSTALGKETEDGTMVWDASQRSCEGTFGAVTRLVRERPEHLRIAARPAHAGFLILRLRSFPAWQVKVNGQLVNSLPRRSDGLIAVPVPAGPVDLTVDWTTTPDVVFARWLTLLSGLALTGLWLFERRSYRAQLS